MEAQRAVGNQAVSQLLVPDQHEMTRPPALVDAALGRTGRPLESQVQRAMEATFGEDLQNVRVHTDPLAAASAAAAGALAYSRGDDIVFGSGQYAPETSGGQALIQHELTHVVAERLSPAAGRTIFRAPADSSRLLMPPPTVPAPIVSHFGRATVATVYFAHNSALLDAANHGAVARLAEDLRFLADPSIAVDGHASQEGAASANLRLSAMRRDLVIQLLKGKALGTPSFTGTAHGAADPAVEEAGDATALEHQRSLNRRVTIVVQRPAVAEARSPEPQKPIDIDIHVRPRPETDEERANRMLRTPLPAPTPKTSTFNKEFWKVVDDAVDRVTRSVGIPDKYRGHIRDAARSAIEKGAEAALDKALEAAGASETQKKAVKAAIKQAAGTEL